MIRVALKGLAAARCAPLLTALAIVLGVAMVSGGVHDHRHDARRRRLPVGRRLRRHRRRRRRAHRVQGRHSNDCRPRSRRSTPPCSTRSARCPRSRSRSATSPTRPRSSTATASPRRRPVLRRRLRPRTPGAEQSPRSASQDGRWATGPGEVVIDAPPPRSRATWSARPCRSRPAARRATSRVVGIARFGNVKSLGTATSPCSTSRPRRSCSTSRAATTGPRRRPGVARRDVRAAVAAAVGPARQVQTAAAQDRFTLDGLKQFISIIKIVLLVFGGVAILVGAFTIFNTLSITVAQRTREFALLRMVGAVRRQVLGSVLLEALALGSARRSSASRAGFGARDRAQRRVRRAGPRAARGGHGVRGADRDRRRCSSARSSR